MYNKFNEIGAINGSVKGQQNEFDNLVRVILIRRDRHTLNYKLLY